MSKRKSEKSCLGQIFKLIIVVLIIFAGIKVYKKLDNKPAKTTLSRSVPSKGPTKYSKGQDNLYDLTGPVVDTANLLSKSQYNELDSFLRNLDKNSGVQIAVLTVDSLNGESIEAFSIRHAEKWKLGQKGVDNGALLVAAMEEHDLRIETGYGTEAAFTDAKCSRIINNILIPKFRSEKYGEGIVEAVKSMAGIITSDESLISKEVDRESPKSNTTLYIIIGILLFVFLGVSKFIFPIFGHSSSRGGSFLGDIFSGGGGSFGGGGASGHW